MPLTPSVPLSCARSQQRRQSSGVPPVLVSRRPLSVCISPMLHPPCCAPAHPTTPIPQASCIPTAHQRAPPSQHGCTSSFRAPRSAAVYRSHTRPPQPHYISATSPHNTRSQAGIIHRSLPRSGEPSTSNIALHTPPPASSLHDGLRIPRPSRVTASWLELLRQHTSDFLAPTCLIPQCSWTRSCLLLRPSRAGAPPTRRSGAPRRVRPLFLFIIGPRSSVLGPSSAALSCLSISQRSRDTRTYEHSASTNCGSPPRGISVLWQNTVRHFRTPQERFVAVGPHDHKPVSTRIQPLRLSWWYSASATHI